MICKTVIENGGKVLPNDQRSNYIIMNDGYDHKIWSREYLDRKNTDDQNRNIIHFRWIEESIRNKNMFDHCKALHLCPMPQKVPITAFQKTKVAFTCLDELEKAIFFTMADLYGLRESFEDGKTDFLIVVNE